MSNLTITIREQIVDNVILRGTTIPKQKEGLKKRTEARVREICLASVPKEFEAAVKTLPATWFPHLASIEIYKDVNPVAISSVGPLEAKRSRWYGPHISFEPIKHPYANRFDRHHYARQTSEQTEDDPESWEVLLADLIEEAKQIWEAETTARKELMSFLVSVRTYKQVLEKMPELEPHLPNYSKPMPLTVSVTPILKTLNSLGFDQTKKPVKKGKAA